MAVSFDLRGFTPSMEDLYSERPDIAAELKYESRFSEFSQNFCKKLGKNKFEKKIILFF